MLCVSTNVLRPTYLQKVKQAYKPFVNKCGLPTHMAITARTIVLDVFYPETNVNSSFRDTYFTKVKVALREVETPLTVRTPIPSPSSTPQTRGG